MAFRNFDHASADAQIALTEFLADFETALVGGPLSWARDMGHVRSSRALRTRWPVPLTTAGYQRFNGDPRYRSLEHLSVELIKENWQDGIAELKSTVEAPDFFGWNQEPSNIALAFMALPNNLIRDVLATATADVSPITGEIFFSNAHPNNIIDPTSTFDNLHAGQTVNIANLATAKNNFRQIKSASGEALGARLTHILSPANLEAKWKDVLEQSLTVLVAGDGAVDNRHKGTAQLWVGDELPDDVWYSLSLNKPGLVPWALIEGIREDFILGTDSALFEKEGKVGFDSRAELVGGMIFPHAIQRHAV